MDGQDVTGTAAERMAAIGVAQVRGDRAIVPDMTVYENLLVGGHLLGKRAKDAAECELDRFPPLGRRRAEGHGLRRLGRLQAERLAQGAGAIRLRGAHGSQVHQLELKASAAALITIGLPTVDARDRGLGLPSRQMGLANH